MATQLFLLDVFSDYHTGNNDANLRSSNIGWISLALGTARGSGLTSSSTATVAGATPGVEVGTVPLVWYSPPLDADITISGSVTWNLWADETSMNANVAINGRLEKISGSTGTITLIDQTARTTEVGFSGSRTVQNFSETPAAGVACNRGDRLRVRIFADDAGTMASGFSFSFGYNGTTGGADGDSFITLTENLSFASEPAGSQVFLTSGATAVATASQDYEAWTSRDSGVTASATDTLAGFRAPIQHTVDQAGDVPIDWFTRPLTAFTLGGAVRCNVWGINFSTVSNASIRAEIARVAGDGTSPTVWASGGDGIEVGTSDVARSFLIAGDDLAISDGQRLRIRLYADDCEVAMGTTGAQVKWGATSGGATGDTYFTFTQTLTELIQQDKPPVSNQMRQLLAH